MTIAIAQMLTPKRLFPTPGATPALLTKLAGVADAPVNKPAVVSDPFPGVVELATTIGLAAFALCDVTVALLGVVLIVLEELAAPGV
jgi:hypothetical protein